MMHRTQITLLVSSVLVPAVSGCKHWQEAQFNQGIGVGEDAVLLVPFAEPRKRLWYGESDDGRFVAEAVKRWAMKNALPNFPEEDATLPVLQAVRDTTEKTISAQHWQRLTKTIGVKYVVYGQIEAVALTKPGHVGYMQPNVQATYRVIDLAKARVAYESPLISLDALSDLSQMPEFSLNEDPQKARANILTRLGTRIGQDLYGYYKE